MIRSAVAACCLSITCFPVNAVDFVDRLIRGFAESEIVFARSKSNVPFVPLAYIDLSLYSDTEVQRPQSPPLEYDLTTVSQGAFLPMPVGSRDAVMVGEWIGVSKFEAGSEDAESFNALSVGLPLGWMRQIDDRLQVAAFVMPLAHRADLDGSDWSNQTLGGAFGRYEQDARLWWAYGFYFDVGSGDDVYLPYLGASWEIDEQLTVSAILPWPAVLYAPDRDTLWRFGASPSEVSWSLNSDQDEILYSLDNWKLGLSAEHRMSGNFWFSIRAGVAGLRSLRLEGGEWRKAEFDVEESAFVSIGVNFRPELP